MSSVKSQCKVNAQSTKKRNSGTISAHNRKVEEWYRRNQKAIAQWERANANAGFEEKKVWVEGRKAVAASKESIAVRIRG